MKRGDGVVEALLPMMAGAGYYSSFMTDHDMNKRNHCYCTDTSFGVVATVHEALLFSNSGEIELLPALPSDWTSGSIHGLMARTRVEVKRLTWDMRSGAVHAVLCSCVSGNAIRLSAGTPWTVAKVDGVNAEAQADEAGAYMAITLNAGLDVTVESR